jgi:hypothetical protein
MAVNGSKATQVAVAAVVVLFTVITLFGLNGQVQTLQAQVRELNASIATLDEVEAQIVRLQQSMLELARFRDDILAAVCAANARTTRDLRQCERFSSGAAGQPPPASVPRFQSNRGGG